MATATKNSDPEIKADGDKALTTIGTRYVPDLCRGCKNLELDCGKLAAWLEFVGNVQINECGLYDPIPKGKE